MTDDQMTLLEAVGIESKTAGAGGYLLPLHADLETAVALCANLQLALRHPQNAGASAEIARHVIDSIIKRLRADGFIASAALVELGDNPAYDV
jgi:hypothetical protein